MQFKPLLALAGLIGIVAVFVNVPSARADAADEVSIGPKDPAAAAADHRMILLKAAQFDPMVSEPEANISRFWKADVEPTAGSGTYIVQFHGAIMPEWQQGLKDHGATILGYIPNNALLVSVDVERLGAIRGLETVRWVGHYRNWYKIDPRLAHVVINGDAVVLDNAALGVPLRVVGYHDTDGPALQKLAGRMFSGLSASKGQVGGWKGKSADLGINYSRLPDFLASLAANENVHWIQYRYPAVPHNNDSVWVTQSNDTGTGPGEATAANGSYPNSGTFFRQGLLGQGQVVGNSDSGTDRDMCFFRNSATNCPGGCLASQAVPAPGVLTLTPGERKIIAYNVFPDATDGDVGVCSNHGTHTVGSMIGDNLANIATGAGAVGHNTGDGMAPMAKMVFQDIGRQSVNQAECDVFSPPQVHPCCLLYGIPANLVDMFQQAYTAGVRIHSNSWGSADNAYDDNASQIDTFIYNNRDMSIFFSAGNDGAGGPNTTGSPSNNKNGLAVAWFNNGSTNRDASSSIGPTADGRVKPDIGAPGSATVSAGGDGNLGTNNCGTAALSGTSMASPTAAGAATLLRQYFTGGFYPTGAAVPANAMNPSAALMKATLFSGARNVTGAAAQGAVADPQTGNGAAPNIRQGFGAVQLNQAVGFSANEHALWANYRTRLWDLRDAQGVGTGITQEYNVDVAAGTPLAITVSWSDPPGLVGAAVALVNNLNLVVIGPSGTYRGNQFTASGTAHRLSTLGAAGSDVLNNTEQFYLAAPAAGNYRIQIVGANVPGNNGVFSQGYGLAVVGNLTTVTTACTQAAPTAVTATPNGANRIDLTWAAAAGATRYGIYRNNNPATCGSDFQQIAQVGAVTAYSDLTVNGGYTYNYKIAAIMPCESPLSATCGTGAATGNCTLKPTFAGASGATGLNQATCGNTVTWGSGSSNCPLGNSVSYNIYRGTAPNFVPAVGNRIASCQTGGTYTDTSATLLSGNTFFYVVKAEDTTTANGGPCNGGNEDANVVRYAATPYGVGTQAGGATWTDGGGDTTALLSLNSAGTGNNGTPWRYITTTTDPGAPHLPGISAYRTSGPLTTDTYGALLCAEIATPNLTTSATTASLTYWERHNLEWQWDGTMVEFSTNNGTSWATVPNPAPATDWGPLAQTTSPPVNQCGYLFNGQPGFTGPNPNPATSSAYLQRTHALTGLTAGGTVKLRWRLSSDPALNFQGSYIDEIALTNIRLPNACTPGGGCTAPSGVNAPTVADASACLASGINVTWVTPTWGGTPGTYVILRDGVAVAGGACSGNIPAATLTCLDTTGSAGAHTYQVRATNGCASSTTSAASGSITDASDVTAPTMTTQSEAKAAPNINFSWSSAEVGASYATYSAPTLPATWTLRNTTPTLGWINAVDLGAAGTFFYTTTAADACGNASPQ